jgi:tetratricopeptide (TPR) repeat protein
MLRRLIERGLRRQLIHRIITKIPPAYFQNLQLLQKAATDLFTFNQMISELLKFSLVKRLSDYQTLSIHRLVQAVQQDMMEPHLQRQWAQRVVRAVNQVFPSDPQDIATWPQCRRYLDQAQACHRLIEHHQIQLTEAAAILNRAGLYLDVHGLYAIAEPLLQHGLAMREQQLRREHLDTAASINNLASLYESQGRYPEAESLYKRALSIHEQQLGPTHPETATSLNNLASLYESQGKYAEAEPLYKRTLSICERQLGSEHPNTATSLNNLAELYQAQGKYREAEPLYQHACAICEQQLGHEHPHTRLVQQRYTTLLEKMKQNNKGA